MKRIIFVVLGLLISVSVNANVLFEGYAKVLLSGVHAGYYISRYEFDSAKKQYISIYFLKTNELGGNLTESLKAYCDDKFVPISYQYTSVLGSVTKTIDMTFKNGKMTGVISNMGKEEKIDKVLPNKKVILSTFLGYVMSTEPQGLMVRKEPYIYQAIAEEDGEVYQESALIKEIETVSGIKTFKIVNDFKDIKFTSYVTDKGDVLLTKAPVQGIATELVADPKEAIKNFPINEKNLTLLFGGVPKGERNALFEMSKAKDTNQSQTVTTEVTNPATQNPNSNQVKKDKLPPQPKPSSKVGKSHGVPQGIGIQVKGK